jgi:hypothetical protein
MAIMSLASGGVISIRPTIETVDRCDHQRRPGAPLAGHLVAVDAGDDGSGLARNADQDRRCRAAVHRTVEDAGQHDDPDGGIGAVGQRQQQRHAGEGAEARQHADDRAPQAADEAVQQSLPGQRDRKSVDELVEA